MKFRLKAFGFHLLGSAAALSLILGSLWFGWYHWPGWYLAGVTQVVKVMAGVDVVLGPLLTFVVASAKKPRRELARDISMIAAVQLIALIYGATSLWNGRPLYYAFSEDVLQLVQAYDINPEQAELGRKHNPPLAPHWYSVPRWIWAPLPKDEKERDKIITSSVSGGDDVISLPTHFRPWQEGTATLRSKLKKLGDLKYFGTKEQTVLTDRMRAAGLPPDAQNSIAFLGRSRPLLAVFDPATLTLLAIFKAD